MLFNSYVFIFVFLPTTLAGFFLLGRWSDKRIALSWLVLASLLFYSWEVPRFVVILIFSFSVNFGFAKLLSFRTDHPRRQVVLFCAVTANLALLAYFKYTNFLVANFTAFTGVPVHIPEIVLPIGISFFTFTQIAYLVDISRGDARETSFVRYALFVTYFPHLVAGPIFHHRDILPQFAQERIFKINALNLSVGLTIFFIGLFKKTVLADSIAQFVTPFFAGAEHGEHLTIEEAWLGTLSYTFQIYFDFSGYSDMAIGLSRLLGVQIPLNFNSPYKAASAIDFWRRWHMSLSQFLRDYLYFPLGGNRRGSFRRYVNLMLTMLIGGLWHGASWTFVAWGGLHGLYLVMNHGWRAFCARVGWRNGGWFGRSAIGRPLTFLGVVVAWVFFRAHSFAAATSVLGSMFGFSGIRLSLGLASRLPSFIRAHVEAGGMFPHLEGKIDPASAIGLVGLLWLVSWFFPNTQEILRDFRPTLDRMLSEIRVQGLLRWQPTLSFAVATACVAFLGILAMSAKNEFLYYSF